MPCNAVHFVNGDSQVASPDHQIPDRDVSFYACLCRLLDFPDGCNQAAGTCGNAQKKEAKDNYEGCL